MQFDLDEDRARRLASEVSAELGLAAHAVPDLGEATRTCDVCVTCTTAREAFLEPDMVSSGTFVAAVGADNPEKHEITPSLMRSAKVVVDSLEQCREIGDLHHALRASVLTEADVYATLADVVSGKTSGRTSPEEVIVFDSTGTALQDVASAAVIYARAIERGRGIRVKLRGGDADSTT